jgi:hypothetical protein
MLETLKNGLALSKNRKENDHLARTVTELIKKQKPHSVQQLIELTKAETSVPAEEIIEQITQLQAKGIIEFKQPPQPTSQVPSSYLKQTGAYWYWITVSLAIVTAISVFTIAESSYPLAYIRHILGSVFILFLPGYAFTKALFPTHMPFQTSSEGLDSTIRAAFSIGLSLALVPVITLLLDYTPLGVRLTPILLSVLAVTLVSATIGVAREQQGSRTLREERDNHGV